MSVASLSPPSTTAERKDDKSNYGGDKQWLSLAKKNTAAIISRSVISMLTAAKTTPVCPVRLGICWSMPVNGKYCKRMLSEHLLSYMGGSTYFSALASNFQAHFIQEIFEKCISAQR